MSNTPLIRRRRRRAFKMSATTPDRSRTYHPHTKPQRKPKPGECRCGESIHPIYVDRCENCWAIDQVRWSGKSKRVRILFNG